MDSDFTKYYNQLMNEVNLVSNIEKISDTKKRLALYLTKKFKNIQYETS